MYSEKIGLIGGFGAYATLDFYKRILKEFASESERNYPHIIMDNNFTMPSRTKALLYGNDYDEVVLRIAESMKLMLHFNVDKIILVCGTAHFFLDDVYKIIPEAEEKVIDIIEVLGKDLNRKNISNVLVIAAEGTLLKELYPQKLRKYGISCINPSQNYYKEIRYFIECVKQNKLNEMLGVEFIGFLNKFSTNNVILGCTEFPVLVDYIVNNCACEQMKSELKEYVFYDPLEGVLEDLKRTLQ